MPSWLCRSSKKNRNRSSTRSSGKDAWKRDDSAIQTSSGQPSFAVVVQNFVPSVSDELSIERGQVVESLHSDGNWVYVRNIDGKCGYVPKTFCHPLEQMRRRSEKDSFRLRPKSLHVHEIPASPSPLSTCSTQKEQTLSHKAAVGDGTPACEVATRQASEQITTLEHTITSVCESVENTTPAGNDDRPSDNALTQNSESREVASRCNGTTDSSNRPVSLQRCASPSSPASPAVHGEASSILQQPSCSSRSLHRANSYQQAVLSAGGQCSSKLVFLESKSAAMPAVKAEAVATVEHEYDVLDKYSTTPASMDYENPDDVFLPTTKKPLQMFSCASAYRARFEGEVSLQLGEVVVVTEYGQGEWAWVVTGRNSEGLIPKSVLQRYSPTAPVQCQVLSRADAATQTELVISSPIHNKALYCSTEWGRVCSSAGTAGSVEGSCGAEQVSRQWFRSTDLPGQVTQVEGSPVDSRPRSLEMPACTPPRPAVLSTLPLPSPPGQPSRPRTLLCRQSSLPATHTRCRPTPPSTLPTPLGSTFPLSTHVSAEAHSGRPPFPQQVSLDLEPQCQPAGVGQGVHRMPVLTAVRDYQPPSSARNCISMQRGDVLYLQAQAQRHRGWTWVYHTTHKCYGYVPRSHVAYLYLLQQRNRRTDSVENSV